MSYYRKKRMKSGLTKSDIAMELGIDYIKYDLIEKGEIKMPTNLIDKFNEIVNRGKNENKLTQLERERKVSEWYNNMVTKENGRYKLYDKMEEFNIDTFKELALLLGYKDSSILSHYLCKRVDLAPYDFKNKLYTFFENELNMQPKKVKEIKEKIVKQRKNTELLDWYNSFDLDGFMKEHNLSSCKISKDCELSTSQVNRLRNREHTPREDTLIKLKKWYDNFDKNEVVVEEPIEESVPVKYEYAGGIENISIFNPYQEQQERLVAKYTNILKMAESKEQSIYKSIDELNGQLADILKEKTIYKTILRDIVGEENVTDSESL